jgi:hypothetical protein
MLHDRVAVGRRGIQLQRFFVAVEHREIQRVEVRNVPQLPAGDVAHSRAFNLQHVGAEPRQQLGASGSCLHARKNR